MARIETYTAQQGLNPGSTPDVRLVNPVAEEMQKIGQTVTSLAGTLIQRQEQRENFKVENDYRKLQLDLQDQMTKQAAEMPPDGEGFHDQFITNTFKPARDQFLATVPERVRPKFEAILADGSGSDFTEWSIRSATQERDQNYVWQRDEIKVTQDQLAAGIATNSPEYDNYLEQGKGLIAASSLPKPEKDKLYRDWENMAQVAMLNTMLTEDPQGIFRELGYDPRQLSPTTQRELLFRAVQWQESADNPNAISPKGAIGLMQVMPETAREIAGKIGDTSFPPPDASRDAVERYMSNPAINKQYGEYYLSEQLRTFSGARDPIEAALIAYNAGPSVAQKWVESGYDDKLLPKETRDYKAEIMGSLKSSPVKGDPQSVSFVGNVEGTSPDLQNRLKDAFATIGLTKVKINSGHRSKAENDAAGGAEGSQHLDGNAMDIDVSGMKITERIELIKALSNSGITGIGVGSNIIHADLGGRRAWGYATSAGGGEVPAWAKPVIGQHLNGTTPPPRATSQRYASLPYDTRNQFTSKADQLLSQRAAAATKSTAVEKVNVKRAMENELALVRSTGQGSGTFDDTNVSTILGEDDYITYQRKREVAQKTFTATSGISTMAPEDMGVRVSEYAPDPNAGDFADQQLIQAAVQKEVDRVTNLRAKQPDKAALEFPEVKGVYEALQEKLVQGNAEPGDVQGFVAQMLDTQGQFGVAPQARAPVTSEWAMEIGRSLSRTPEPTSKNRLEVRSAIQVQYEELKKYFGDYTDEVIVYSLSEYKGLSKPLAETIGAAMTAISTGGDPFRRAGIDAAQDQDQVEGFSAPRVGFGGSLFDPFEFNAETEGLSAEEVLRQQEATEE